jgi:hypothetical protein
MFTMNSPRPDSAYAFRVLSWYNHHPSNEDLIALKHMFWYLNGTTDWQLRFVGALRGALDGEGARGC